MNKKKKKKASAGGYSSYYSPPSKKKKPKSKPPYQDNWDKEYKNYLKKIEKEILGTWWTCGACLYEWKPKVKVPKRCPDCKSSKVLKGLYSPQELSEEDSMQIPRPDGTVLEIPVSQMLPATDRHPIRFEVGSDSSSNVYTIARNNKQNWECSCPGWKSRRKCKHLRKLGLEKATSNSFTTGYKQNSNILKADDFTVKDAPVVLEEVSKTRKISFDD